MLINLEMAKRVLYDLWEVNDSWFIHRRTTLMELLNHEEVKKMLNLRVRNRVYDQLVIRSK